MLGAPRSAHLRGVPLRVRLSGEPLVPQWIRVIQNPIEQSAVGRDESHLDNPDPCARLMFDNVVIPPATTLP